ncbi:hypothetical protein SAMN04489712_1455 [Thermomonospora echinospora]|uniref:Uncharacterized protein n=1 Tax=Thermomonospora echinospora TaxID=1992 RepID=A0A1H6EAJ1_9ACTN|nr:hypothetical protein [Thermomonospora echinospora]SEG94271.1 hypothetical protein SAMN04489712_1455 [Thermomonospora echinospora]
MALGGAIAPYARAGAIVNADGSVIRSKGVTAVRKTATGRYCIELEAGIDASTALVVATPKWGANWDSIVLVNEGPVDCGDASRNVFVGTGRPSGAADEPFVVVVL